jgi:Amt family ammonium transporter
MFKLIQMTVGLRVSAEEELAGLDLGEHGASAYPDFQISSRTFGLDLPTGAASPEEESLAASPVSQPAT